MDERQRQVIDQMVRAVAAQVAALEATVRSGFASEARRLDDFMDQMGSQHSENSERLERIENKQDTTNGRVATHDALIKYVIPAVIGAVTVTAAVIIWILTLIGKI